MQLPAAGALHSWQNLALARPARRRRRRPSSLQASARRGSPRVANPKRRDTGYGNAHAHHFPIGRLFTAEAQRSLRLALSPYSQRAEQPTTAISPDSFGRPSPELHREAQRERERERQTDRQ